jgi:predicted MFS family arabinose efflux permease
MTDRSQPTVDAGPVIDVRVLQRVLAAATFLIFFQAFMIAPLIPRLAVLFGSAPSTLGWAVPAYLIPYGVMTLVWGPLSDRAGRGPVIVGSLGAFVVLTAATAAADSAGVFLAARVATAVGASGVVPICLALIGDVVPARQRGRALGTFFAAMAGGVAFGSSAGALVEPVLGWRGLFLTVAGAAAVALIGLVRLRRLFPPPAEVAPPVRFVARGYVELLADRRGRRTYTYVFLNGALHAGVYTWLGLYFERRFDLGPVGIGLALLGYGLPGFLIGPLIGRRADRSGRARLIPLGMAVAAACALVFAADIPLGVAAVTVPVLSLGYDLTQPLLAGIVTQLSTRRGQAMGLNVFTLFVGSGLGSLAFQILLTASISTALVAFGALGLVAAGVAVPMFRTEIPAPT